MSKKQILIVDDEILLLKSLKHMLEDLYDVTIATGGHRALDLINEKDRYFDLIIVDVLMPDINGVNLYLEIAKQHPGLEKKIIFITGSHAGIYHNDFFRTIDNMQLEKPFDYEDLRQLIKDFFNANSILIK